MISVVFHTAGINEKKKNIERKKKYNNFVQNLEGLLPN